MPSSSKAQENIMRAAAHSKKFAAKVKIPQEVARELYQEDQKKHGRRRKKNS